MRFRPADHAWREVRAFALALAGGSWRRALLRATVAVVALAAGAVFYAWTGLVPLAASSGHSALTYWYLDFAKRNGVETLSLGTNVPPLDDRALLLKGAGHYATGCAPCHGAPGRQRAVVSSHMTPEPPLYSAKFSRWDAAEMFWIVKHGIKFTGMPSWPVQDRDDEVWAVVSFLQALPAMNAAVYERLAYGEHGDDEAPPNRLQALAEPVRSVLADCARCHGLDGNGRGAGAFPKLAGQNEAYLAASLQAFADRDRHSGVMQPPAANLDARTRRALAAYFSELPRSAERKRTGDDALIQRGRKIAEHGMPERGLPACNQCHGAGLNRNPMYPELAGQYAAYLELQLELFERGARGGTPYAHIMETVTRRMTAEDRRAVALYFASLPPERD